MIFESVAYLFRWYFKFILHSHSHSFSFLLFSFALKYLKHVLKIILSGMIFYFALSFLFLFFSFFLFLFFSFQSHAVLVQLFNSHILLRRVSLTRQMCQTRQKKKQKQICRKKIFLDKKQLKVSK